MLFPMETFYPVFATESVDSVECQQILGNKGEDGEIVFLLSDSRYNFVSKHDRRRYGATNVIVRGRCPRSLPGTFSMIFGMSS